MVLQPRPAALLALLLATDSPSLALEPDSHILSPPPLASPRSGKDTDPATVSAAAFALNVGGAAVLAKDDGGDFGRRAGESRGDFLRREYSALKPFVIISLSYLLYTTTDGAIRMIVLLHAYNLGFTAWEVCLFYAASLALRCMCVM